MIALASALFVALRSGSGTKSIGTASAHEIKQIMRMQDLHLNNGKEKRSKS